MIPPKPRESQWTDEQWQAIYATGKHTLVAAAAGSGKTAVLVERIIQKILHKERPIDVDRLLVVTFTNAAAAEMRQRIGEALEKALEKEPHSLHLRRQLSLLQKASISTIHSFCLDVIRKYYYVIGIDPVFRIADEGEMALLKEEVLETLFEQYYADNDEAFLAVVDRYTSDRTDADLQTLILRLYEFSRSHPNPNEWLQQIVHMYDVAEHARIDDLPYAHYLFQAVDLAFEAAEQRLLQALQKTKEPGGPDYLHDTLASDQQVIAKLKEARDESWQKLHEAMKNVSFATAKRKPKDGAYDEQLVDDVKKLREQVKKEIGSLTEELFSFQPATYIRHLREMKPIVATIVQIVQRFAKLLQTKKDEKGIVDFSDLEHYCLRILRASSMEHDLKPSEAALYYRAQFAEVLVDEYQDTNMVQESILRLVSNDDEATGNMFMVGDVKQSIYGFRLAEPSLFLQKYDRFTKDGEGGLRIDLAKNFRSRKEILDATNFIFRQLMTEAIGDMRYDDEAALRFGALDYPEKQVPVECVWLNEAKEESEEEEQQEDVTTAQLEARWIAKKIKQLLAEPFFVYDRRLKGERRLMYRDIVILCRSMSSASAMLEEFRKQNVPVYAELSSGYFSATEVSIMLSLLKVIDNPYQDIPLAAVLRSPIVGLSENDLARIRLAKKDGAFYEALIAFVDQPPHDELHEKMKRWLSYLLEWRTAARQKPLADLIWQLYRDTNFYDYVGGMPGGKQRQANLRALYDRAKQYEQTSFRGIFRFLRFIERLKEREDDFGAARSLTEQEDVVRMMTIHKSKGLEFPVVFLAGAAKSFNMQDLRGDYILDKDFGLGMRFVHPTWRASYPTVAQLAIKKKMKLQLLAEEMRILYVALTRAKEKLYIVCTAKDIEAKKKKWQEVAYTSTWELPAYMIEKAKSYADWIGYALVRHRQGICSSSTVLYDPSLWDIYIVSAHSLEQKDEQVNEHRDIVEAIQQLQPVPMKSEYEQEIKRRLFWTYTYADATVLRAKQSVSELKRQRDIYGGHAEQPFRKELIERPRFLQAKTMTPAERGTMMHLVMQHIDVTKEVTVDAVQEQIARMVHGEWLTEEQAKAVDVESIVAFFNTPLGKRMQRAARLEREVPFYLAHEMDGETVVVQGVIDCVFEDEQGLVLIDYKTDRVSWMNEPKEELRRRYKGQLALYREAIEAIWKKEVTETYVYAFDGALLVPMEGD
ncbi:helicase-exonuclease AddAB subunit AddA [Anoxybacillus suryakundensis]|uniref:ATP-dependent helicase/nuclease subunit A n=1 Tax=Anoxybacillus suryakundensis TaxID=1325335 RepID=A0A0K6GKP3_9BACL|nr:helicase-exonuclease AddAB subunit AddA [Anoxybacillus suryakundensis]CUA79285.1 DNA helicase/exodeoxyribonuclease V, subunit A [Anoxybacillus suryakundensis]